MSTRTRKDPTTRKAELLTAAVALAVEVGIPNVTRREVARRTETTDGLVTRYFGSAEGLRKAVTKVVKRDGHVVPDKKESDRIGKELRARSKVTGPVIPVEVVKKAAARKPEPSGVPKSL